MAIQDNFPRILGTYPIKERVVDKLLYEPRLPYILCPGGVNRIVRSSDHILDLGHGRPFHELLHTGQHSPFGKLAQFTAKDCLDDQVPC
jgi:hypothetical protein